VRGFGGGSDGGGQLAVAACGITIIFCLKKYVVASVCCVASAIMRFLSDFGEESRQPGIDPCRRLVHSYATVG
jgi:hypothetical protein